MKQKKLLIFGMLLTLSLAACSYTAGSGVKSSPAKFYDSSDNEIKPNAADVAVDTSFTAKFEELIDGNTFEGNFFIVPGTKFEPDKNNFDPEICISEDALPAELVDCDDQFIHNCTLQPSSPLSEDTAYTICVMEEATYSSGQSFGGSALSFTTVASEAAAQTL